jgi:hypothetical protein
LKVEILDTYKNRPPLPTIQIAVLMAFVYKSWRVSAGSEQAGLKTRLYDSEN